MCVKYWYQSNNQVKQRELLKNVKDITSIIILIQKYFMCTLNALELEEHYKLHERLRD